MENTQEAETNGGAKAQGRNVTIESTPGRSGMPGGHITLDENVVATIAGLAAREVQGIHALGKSRLISFGSEDPTHGVAAEVGKKQAAFDLDAILDYGADIKEVAGQLREKIASEVKKMAGREVVEINIHVIDLHFPESETQQQSDKQPRVI